MMKKMIVVGTVLLLSACATTYQPSYIYYRVEVVNNSNETLSDVKVTMTGFGRSLDCGDIAPLRNCYRSFGKRRYINEPIKVDWAFAGGPSQNNEFVIVPPATYSTGVPMRAVIDVSPEGEMTAYFEQETVF